MPSFPKLLAVESEMSQTGGCIQHFVPSRRELYRAGPSWRKQVTRSVPLEVFVVLGWTATFDTGGQRSNSNPLSLFVPGASDTVTENLTQLSASLSPAPRRGVKWCLGGLLVHSDRNLTLLPLLSLTSENCGCWRQI